MVKRSSIGLMSSPCFPSLLESPPNTNAENDQNTRSSESKAGTSANVHDESCFSIPMEPKGNLTGHHLHQIQSGSNSKYLYSSHQVSELDRLMGDSSYMHNLMVNDQRINMNEIPTTALFSVSNIRRDQITAKLDQQPGIQQLPGLQPSIVCDPHMPLTSNYSNLRFPTDEYFSALHSAGIPVEPFSSSSLHR